MQFNIPLCLFLAGVLGIVIISHQQLEQHFDFGVFYFAAHMVLDGSRHALYDLSTQHTFQILFHRPPDTLFINPPVALLPILPLAKLPVLAAFGIWTAISLALLWFSLKVLEREAQTRYGNWPVLLSVAFAPILGGLLHGQYSLLIVAAYAATYALWRRGRLFLGGMVFALATIKFQTVLGMIAILCLRRRWRELSGFAAGSALLLAISAWMVGVHSLLAYPHFILNADLPVPEISHFANWHGLLFLIGADRVWLLAGLSMATIACAVKGWQNLDRGFAGATLASILVGVHLTPQDLSLVLIPFFLCIKAEILPRARAATFALPAIVGTLAMVTLHAPLALLAIPLSVALVWIAIEPLKDSTFIENASRTAGKLG